MNGNISPQKTSELRYHSSPSAARTTCLPAERDALAQSRCTVKDIVSASSLLGYKWPQRERTSWNYSVAAFSPASNAAFLWKREDTAPFSSTETRGRRSTVSRAMLASLADHLLLWVLAQLTVREGRDARAAGSSLTPGQVPAITFPCPTTKPPLHCSSTH